MIYSERFFLTSAILHSNVIGLRISLYKLVIWWLNDVCAKLERSELLSWTLPPLCLLQRTNNGMDILLAREHQNWLREKSDNSVFWSEILLGVFRLSLQSQWKNTLHHEECFVPLTNFNPWTIVTTEWLNRNSSIANFIVRYYENKWNHSFP